MICNGLQGNNTAGYLNSLSVGSGRSDVQERPRGIARRALFILCNERGIESDDCFKQSQPHQPCKTWCRKWCPRQDLNLYDVSH